MLMEDLDRANQTFVDSLVSGGVLKSRRIIEAFRKLPRHLFVRGDLVSLAYYDAPIPLTGNSTVSQPSTVAAMLELIEPKEGDRFLEIGTGSGWNAALISYCVGRKGSVVTLEIDGNLCRLANENLERFGIDNVRVICTDGADGYADCSPYSKIIYTVATDRIPDSVIGQLEVKGLLVAPVGADFIQTMTLVKKLGKNRIESKSFGGYQFVHMMHRKGRT